MAKHSGYVTNIISHDLFFFFFWVVVGCDIFRMWRKSFRCRQCLRLCWWREGRKLRGRLVLERMSFWRKLRSTELSSDRPAAIKPRLIARSCSLSYICFAFFVFSIGKIDFDQFSSWWCALHLLCNNKFSFNESIMFSSVSHAYLTLQFP